MSLPAADRRISGDPDSDEGTNTTMKKRTLLLGSIFTAALAFAPGAAQAAGTVVVYTAHRASIVEALVPRFEKATGIKVDVVKAGSGDIIKRVKAESGAPRADVIWSIGGEELQANSALLQPYTSKDAAALSPKFKGGTNWLPYSGIVNVFIVNTKLVKPADMPKSWMDLTRPEWKGKISMARADSSGSAFMQLATVLTIYGDNAKGWGVYSKIMANTIFSDSSGAVPRFVNDGEQAVGVTLEDNALDYVRGGGADKIVYPSDGTSAAADGIALVKGAPHADNGKAFIDWCLSKDTQSYLVSAMGRRSVRSDVPSGSDVPPITDVKTVDYNLPWVASHTAAFLKHWTELAHKK
jgi:iron(III) transport system substrate-binding protein